MARWNRFQNTRLRDGIKVLLSSPHEISPNAKLVTVARFIALLSLSTVWVCRQPTLLIILCLYDFQGRPQLTNQPTGSTLSKSKPNWSLYFCDAWRLDDLTNCWIEIFHLPELRLKTLTVKWHNIAILVAIKIYFENKYYACQNAVIL